MPYTFNPADGLYRGPTGTVVAPERISAAVEQVIDAGQARIAVHAQRLADGTTDLLAFRTAMQTEIRTVGSAAAMAAHGGRAAMTASDRGWLGQQLRTQYDYLSNFALDWAQGQVSPAQLLARSQMYAESAVSIYSAGRVRGALARGEADGRSRLGAAEQHCAGCLTEAGKGWTKLANIVPVGSRQCVVRCRCSIETRVPEGAVA